MRSATFPYSSRRLFRFSYAFGAPVEAVPIAMDDDALTATIQAASRLPWFKIEGLAVDRTATKVLFGALVDGLRAMGGNLILQALFVRGTVDNSTEEEVADWVRLVKDIHPRSVQIYTLDRGPADRGLTPVPEDRLRAIASALVREGLEAYAFI